MSKSLLSKIFIFILVMFSTTVVSAQSIKDVRINEIQVRNINGLRDEYGRQSAWIELHNAGYGKVNVGGCMLKVEGKEYRIPRGDPQTIIPTQGYVIFYAGGIHARGTFHTNFTLDNTDYVEFYDVDGKLIDKLRFNPSEMLDDVSYGRMKDNNGKEQLMNLPATTPGANNNTEEKTPRAELFRKADPSGIALTITAIAVVAIALIMLFFIFKYMGEFHMNAAQKKAAMSNSGKKVHSGKTGIITNDELAAIAIALYKYSEELHDNEDTVLTINRVTRVYSPWSSKIYGMRSFPGKKRLW